ncbi:MAG TPA: hydrogenase maturation nickel metallochaperone HypA [Steroidobacteraceae bacterium]|nr:hydrogenase maturation nickel metallochaperone HypA [Steroidobacteraceae bacterium]
MHELSVCQALLEQVTQIASARKAAAVTGIEIEVGPLSGVDAGQIVQAFRALRTGSCAARARLTVRASVVRIRCLECGEQCEVAPNRLVCAGCGGLRSQVVCGDELRLRRVEMEQPGAGN